VSDDVLTVVEISIGSLEAMERADEVVRWLLDTGVVVANPHPDRIRQPSALRAGPAVHHAAPQWTTWHADLQNSGVDVLAERALYHPTQAYEPPACPTCGTQLDEEAHHALMEPWLAGTEPSATCRNCGHSHRLGDWPGSYQVGELAVRFNNWPDLSDGFVADLGSRMGPRWRVVHERY